MTDKPAESAVERYEAWSEDTKDWTPTEGRILADTALAELKAKLAAEKQGREEAEAKLDLCHAAFEQEQMKLAAAEESVRELSARVLQRTEQREEWLARAVAAEAQVEALKVCGLCCHCVGFAGNTPPSCNSPDTVQDEGAFAHFISDVLTPCHFTPSRWQERSKP